MWNVIFNGHGGRLGTRQKAIAVIWERDYYLGTWFDLGW